jgi:hypothetical protein
MLDISAVPGAIAALKGTKDLFDAMMGVRDAATFRAKQVELQSKIMTAQSAVFAANEERAELLEKIARLEKDVAVLINWEPEKQRYKRASVARLVSVYVLAEIIDPQQADYWLCATCFDDRKLTHLQQVPISTGRSLIVACPRCKSVSYIQGQAHNEHANILGKFTR